MKKLILFICLLMVIIPCNVKAASAIASINGPISVDTGQNFVVKLSLYVSDYGNHNAIYDITGLLKYDITVLDLIGVDTSLTLTNNPFESMPNFKFNLSSNNGFKGGEFLMITFKAKKTGDVTFELLNSFATFGKTNTEAAMLMAPSYTINIKQGSYKSSNNNNIKNLSISGYDIAFDKSVTTYKLNLKDNSPLKIDVSLDDTKANFIVVGSERFKVGENEIKIIVTADDGTKKEYKIIATLKEEDNVPSTNQSAGTNSSSIAEGEPDFEVLEEVKNNIDKFLIPAFAGALIILVIVLIAKRPKKKRRYKKKK